MKITYRIGELAKIFNISTDTLRFYEKKGLLRADRDENGYRIYSIFDIWILNVITSMKDLGISLSEIKNFLENRSVANEKNLLYEEHDFLEEKIDRLIRQKIELENRIKILEDASNEDDFYKVKFKEKSQRKIIYTQYDLSTDESVDLAFSNLRSRSDTIHFFNRDFGVVLSKENIKKENFNSYKFGFLKVDINSAVYDRILPEGTYASLRFKGPYKNTKKAYKTLFGELERKKLETADYAIESYLIDINSTSNEDEYVTELEIKIDPA